MSRPGSPRRLLPYGDAAVLIECRDLDETRALHDWLSGRRAAGEADAVTEIVPGAQTLLLRLAGRLDPALIEQLLEAELPPVGHAAAQTLTIGVDYDGEDLEDVAGLLGVDTDEVVARHTARSWTVAFCGFLPGFAYLAPDPSDPDRSDQDVPDHGLRVPRRDSPRSRVPAGAVGLADRWSGIYPRAAPGGWQLIGRTDRTLWDLGQDPPALLQPGTRVRFVAR